MARPPNPEDFFSLVRDTPEPLRQPADCPRMKAACPRLAEAEIHGNPVEPLALEVMTANQLRFFFGQRLDARPDSGEKLCVPECLLGGRASVDGGDLALLTATRFGDE